MHRRTVSLAIAIAVALTACASDEPTDEVVAEPTAEPSPEPEPSPSPEYDEEADLATAQSLVDAWQADGLDLGEVRDNTENQCPDPEVWKCTALLTTDYVSVRVLVSKEEARDYSGPGRETYTVGRVNLSYGGDSDFWPFDTAPYNDVAAEVLGEQPEPR